jgi:hypothetical protein
MAVELSERICLKCPRTLSPGWKNPTCPACIAALGREASAATRRRKTALRKVTTDIAPAAPPEPSAPIPTLVNIGGLGSTLQQELQAMLTIAKAIEHLPRPTRTRVLMWAENRLVNEETA